MELDGAIVSTCEHLLKMIHPCAPDSWRCSHKNQKVISGKGLEAMRDGGAATVGIPNGVIKDSTGDVVTASNAPIFRITTCNIRIGSEAFIEGYPLQKRSAKVRRRFDDISTPIDPGRWPHPEIPSCQMLWIPLTVVCIQSMGDCWLRHIRPDYTGKFARELDEWIKSLFEMCARINMDMDAWSNFAEEGACLPIKLKGYGLREAKDHRFGQLLGVMLYF